MANLPDPGVKPRGPRRLPRAGRPEVAGGRRLAAAPGAERGHGIRGSPSALRAAALAMMAWASRNLAIGTGRNDSTHPLRLGLATETEQNWPALHRHAGPQALYCHGPDRFSWGMRWSRLIALPATVGDAADPVPAGQEPLPPSAPSVPAPRFDIAGSSPGTSCPTIANTDGNHDDRGQERQPQRFGLELPAKGIPCTWPNSVAAPHRPLSSSAVQPPDRCL